MTSPAIVILGASALALARRVQARYPGSQVHGLAERVDADVRYTELGVHLRELYARGTPIVALCAAGIVIRCVAPLLANKGVEPPVLALAEDGSAVVPLLGGLAGVNAVAREIATMLDIAPAITTSGELRFGTCVLNPPPGYALADLAQGKRFISDLLAGESTRIEGDASWLDDASLPLAQSARLAIRVTPFITVGGPDDLLIHPRSVVAAVGTASDVAAGATIAEHIVSALEAHKLARSSLAMLLAPLDRIGDAAFADAARTLDVPLRFAEPGTSGSTDESEEIHHRLLATALPVPHDVLHRSGSPIALAVAAAPVDTARIGQARGRLTVIGIGPGCAELMVPAARDALAEATDILGYATYVKMAGPFRDDQQVHRSDNREELQRARHAFELASAGRAAVVVSSGDPGVFAMAAAVLEALETSGNPRWAAVELDIVPGVSAAMATAAQAGAPLGHDFCMLSLSDNLKPWSIIEARLRHAAEADLVMAFYNPISHARPWQLDRALDIVRAYRAPTTRVVLGRDIGRPGGALTTTTLGKLRASDVDMRTMVIVGSSTTRGFARDGEREWVYTPRWYGQP
ncbi:MULTISPECIES: precorrin-3B C(17)-methyltransferase [Paraburkholderia]|uniref:precorrin-3B C(17)-methyltransferase n=1 Tax=Paraburkholderia TaxID=1822464 RepID=UPI00224E0CD1|nr:MULTISPECIES: precorrin-3B C(17)-methyltransferase [Paraburkholderia]MCX4166064.1 precorrin-3B C(17)-methyltransferase [Paraburkholderia megapolitana]MDN7161554.1 precorrin-3B C(17)-methyltransferase [Paraburkholderia sp. CHISQ3]MDQ6498602.1 precorrin-3B C(17)-methyltransferase [Paraburkholderia megapolitana]